MILTVKDLTVCFGHDPVIQDVSLTIQPNETVALVGPSGSGKSTVALALMGLISYSGTIQYGPGIRPAIIFQDPNTALNPTLKVGFQIAETVRKHSGVSWKQAKRSAISLMERMGIPDAPHRYDDYPMEFSGGMRQRIMIAIAVAQRPSLLIADEPTTSLDATLKGQILDLLADLQKETGMSILLITHDLNLVKNRADRTLVMQAGRIVPKDNLAPKFETPPPGPVGDSEFLTLSSLCKTYDKKVTALKNVDLSIRRGEILGLVGESGSGKSTLGRLILQLEKPSSGQITFSDIAPSNFRREVQIVFQDPYASLNPRMTIYDTLSEGLDIHNLFKGASRMQRLCELLDLVQLPAASLNRFPYEFSGGQRQRIAIARALSVEPSFLVLDEPLSALDGATQSQVLNLLIDLKRSMALTYLFISHDLELVRAFCTRVAVLYRGELVETAATEILFKKPAHAYTKQLVALTS